jgi:hypothetical protein
MYEVEVRWDLGEGEVWFEWWMDEVCWWGR